MKLHAFVIFILSITSTLAMAAEQTETATEPAAMLLSTSKSISITSRIGQPQGMADVAVQTLQQLELDKQFTTALEHQLSPNVSITKIYQETFSGVRRPNQSRQEQVSQEYFDQAKQVIQLSLDNVSMNCAFAGLFNDNGQKYHCFLGQVQFSINRYIKTEEGNRLAGYGHATYHPVGILTNTIDEAVKSALQSSMQKP